MGASRDTKPAGRYQKWGQIVELAGMTSEAAQEPDRILRENTLFGRGRVSEGHRSVSTLHL